MGKKGGESERQWGRKGERVRDSGEERGDRKEV